jgi:hypothetical protein
MGHPPPPPYAPPPGFPAPPPPAPRGPGTLLLVLGASVAAVLIVIGVVAGYLVATGGDGDDPVPASGPVDLRVPLEFKLVAAVSAPPCAGGAVTVQGAAECFTFGSDELTVRRLEAVKAVPPDPAQGSPGWLVQMTLTSADTPGFAELTRKAAEASGVQRPAGRMGMLLGGELVSEPAQVSQAITGGQVQISGPQETFTRAKAEGIVRRLTGR